jgi:SAM-dependent methyltransferase
MDDNTFAVLKNMVKQLCPPLLWSGLSYVRQRSNRIVIQYQDFSPDQQDIEIYWDKKMGKILETWGEGTVWSEIQFLLVNCPGKVLDVACGTGKVMEILSKLQFLDIHGVDISDFLIQKALDRGIPSSRLKVGDATKTSYEDNFFDYAYSIGSLEHFTAEGLMQTLQEIDRVVKKVSFHMVPVSKSGKDEGWVKSLQSYHNNSVDWWLNIYKSIFNQVTILDSTWVGDICLGKWFICGK